MYDISVVVVSYKPKYNSLFATLKSIIAQKNVKFEVIICDDGSDIDYFEQIISYCQSISFCNYQLVKNEVNGGTVKCFLSGLKMARGKFIKDISPGDLLYDENTLYELVNYMNNNNVKVCFGDAVYYNKNNRDIKIFNYSAPKKNNLYKAHKYDYDNIKHRYIVCKDWILGAALAFEKNIVIDYLLRIVDKIKYSDDSIVSLMVLENIRIYYFERNLIWYEYGTGISTNKEGELNHLLTKDIDILFQIIADEYYKDDCVKEYITSKKYDEYPRIKKYFYKYMMHPKRFIYMLSIKIQFRPKKKKQYDFKKLYSWLE